MAIIGGVRRGETFSPEGLENIPHLSRDLLPRALFYSSARNEDDAHSRRHAWPIGGVLRRRRGCRRGMDSVVPLLFRLKANQRDQDNRMNRERFVPPLKPPPGNANKVRIGPPG